MKLRERRPGAARQSAAVEPEPVRSGRYSVLLGGFVVLLRWLVVPAWVVGAALAYHYLPGLSQLPETSLTILIPKDLRALQVEEQARQQFATPLLPRIAVVQRNPNGLSLPDQTKIVSTAARLDRGRLRGFPHPAAAVPVVNTLGLAPAARESSTTAVTYLVFPPKVSGPDQYRLARRYARLVSVPDARAAATGIIPGRLEQAQTIHDYVHWLEIVSLAAILVLLAFYFRSLLAPVVTLVAAGIAYIFAVRVVTELGSRTESVPNTVEPFIVVLLLGVVTDYSVFFLSGMRNRLAAGEPRVDAAKRTAAQFFPIVAVAGLVVAGGVATLRVASIGFLRALGPGMGATVLVGMIVAVTFVPGVLGLLGRAAFWPGIRGGHVSHAPISSEHGDQSRDSRRRRFGALIARRRVALVVAPVTALVLAAGGVGLIWTRLAPTPLGSPNSPANRAAAEAGKGFAPGILSPTEVVVRAGAPIPQRALARFGSELRRVRGTASVVGSDFVPGSSRYDIFTTADRKAARFLVVLDAEPYSADAVDELARLERAAPRLAARAGLGSARVEFAGDTAITRETIQRMLRDIGWVALAAFAVNFVLLVLFLRALVAPLYLVGASLLALATTIGLTTYFFQLVLHRGSLTYYVPIAVGVLLLSFGADYNLLLVGRIWQEAEARPLREAIAYVTPRASRAITVAGLTLAVSFGSLAIVPLPAFREFAFAMAVGVLVDTFVVRSLLIPALVSAVGRASWWPGRRRSDETFGVPDLSEYDSHATSVRPRSALGDARGGRLR